MREQYQLKNKTTRKLQAHANRQHSHQLYNLPDFLTPASTKLHNITPALHDIITEFRSGTLLIFWANDILEKKISASRKIFYCKKIGQCGFPQHLFF